MGKLKNLKNVVAPSIRFGIHYKLNEIQREFFNLPILSTKIAK